MPGIPWATCICMSREGLGLVRVAVDGVWKAMVPACFVSRLLGDGCSLSCIQEGGFGTIEG